jgi:uncharacterized protein
MVHRFLQRAVIALALFELATGPVRADQAGIAQRVATDYAAPRYKALADTAETQAAAWSAACTSPDASQIERLRADFAAAALAWSSISLFHYGPVSEQNRLDRIAFWPDKRNLAEKRLRSMLQGEAPLPDATAMAGVSVAVQGFPALERLLFDDASGTLASAEGAKRCQLGLAIARNIAAISQETAKPWIDPTSALRQSLLTQEGTADMLRRVATDLLASYEFVMDEKIREPIGRKPGEAKPLAAELRRAGLSMRALEVNLASLRDLTAILMAESPDRTAEATIDEAIKVFGNLPVDALRQPDDTAHRGKMLLLLATLTSAHDVAKESIPAALHVTLGFNSSDGD